MPMSNPVLIVALLVVILVMLLEKELTCFVDSMDDGIIVCVDDEGVRGV